MTTRKARVQDRPATTPVAAAAASSPASAAATPPKSTSNRGSEPRQADGRSAGTGADERVTLFNGKTLEGWRLMLSERNKLRGIVTAVDDGAGTAKVTLDLGGNRVVGSIPIEVVRELGLREGSDVAAIMAIVEVSDNVIPAPVLLNDILV